MSVPERIGSQAIGLAGGGGEAGIDHDHACAVLDAPVIEHAEVDRAGFCLVVTDVDVEPRHCRCRPRYRRWA